MFIGDQKSSFGILGLLLLCKNQIEVIFSHVPEETEKTAEK